MKNKKNTYLEKSKKSIFIIDHFIFGITIFGAFL
jgi:hypothetical protein